MWGLIGPLVAATPGQSLINPTDRLLSHAKHIDADWHPVEARECIGERVKLYEITRDQLGNHIPARTIGTLVWINVKNIIMFETKIGTFWLSLDTPVIRLKHVKGDRK